MRKDRISIGLEMTRLFLTSGAGKLGQPATCNRMKLEQFQQPLYTRIKLKIDERPKCKTDTIKSQRKTLERKLLA